MELVQMLVLDIIVSANDALAQGAAALPSGTIPIWYGVTGFSLILTGIRLRDMCYQRCYVPLIVMVSAWCMTLLFGAIILDLDFELGFAERLPGIFLAVVASVWCGRRAERWPDRLWWRFMLLFSVVAGPLFPGVNPSQIYLTIIGGYIIGLLVRWGTGSSRKDNFTEEQKFTGAMSELR